MLWRVLSFSHLWIALGAFVTTAFSWMWCVDGSPMERGGMWVALWVALSTGLGYTIQRAIKHTRHPHTMPDERRRFWDAAKWPMVVVWAGGWLGHVVHGRIGLGRTGAYWCSVWGWRRCSTRSLLEWEED